MSAVAHTTGLNVDQMVADAQKRLAAFVARSAAQQQRRMLEAWGNGETPTPCVPPVGRLYVNGPGLTIGTQPVGTEATPWLDDITPTSPVVDDQDEEDDTELADFALCLMGGAALIFVTGFSLGYLLGS